MPGYFTNNLGQAHIFYKETVPKPEDVDNLEFTSISELLTGGAKNESRFNEIDKLPWAATIDPLGCFGINIY